MLRDLLILFSTVLILPTAAFGQLTDDGKPLVYVTDADVTTNTVWTSDNVYVLDGYVFVEAGETLTIQRGTIVKALDGIGPDASALIVARGGTIIADGTQELPIIFTSIHDDLDDPFDIPFNELPGEGRGRWGGVILLGYAGIGCGEVTNSIEGLPAGDPRAMYGGFDDDDNSGILRYVSIRHGGIELEEANEINGLTMGGVGRGTTISHVEVFFNLDDGFEWFGGTVNCDHLVVAFCGDDCFDYDQGFRGTVNHAFAIMLPVDGDKSGEHDGGTETAEDCMPFATPLFSNVTYMGRGVTTTGSRTFDVRDNAGTGYFNSIFTDYGTYGIKVEVNDAQPTDSWDRLLQGQIVYNNNVWWDFAAGNTSLAICGGVTALESALFGSGLNLVGDPELVSISRTQNFGLDPRPMNLAGAGWTGWIDPTDPVYGFNPPPNPLPPYETAVNIDWPVFPAVGYAGAFDPAYPIAEQWIANWSGLWFYQVLDHNCCNTRGDFDNSGIRDLRDVLAFINWLFNFGAAPGCRDEADLDGNGQPDLRDINYYLNWLFYMGPDPVPCP